MATNEETHILTKKDIMDDQGYNIIANCESSINIYEEDGIVFCLFCHSLLGLQYNVFISLFEADIVEIRLGIYDRCVMEFPIDDVNV